MADGVQVSSSVALRDWMQQLLMMADRSAAGEVGFSRFPVPACCGADSGGRGEQSEVVSGDEGTVRARFGDL